MKRILQYFIACVLITSLLGMPSLKAQNTKKIMKQTYKFQRLIALIDAFYVENKDIEKITEDGIRAMLSELDPHSVYISKDEVKEMNEPLVGEFSGIGIQFNILRDTLMVVSTVSGGPSEKVGLRAGDRITKIDGKNIAGIGFKNSDVRKGLRGDRGSKVNLEIKRPGVKSSMDFVIIRDKIPIHSIDAAYMVDKTIGYIRLSRFAAKTLEEFEAAVKKLKAQGMKDLIFDLTGNSGGYLGAAIGISDHFLNNDKLIVYTDGIPQMRSKSYAELNGLFEDGRLVLMVNENSASASEIVSGAVQDWDRGVIVGHRTFGKGLVQRQFPLTDSSMVRLTIAHYYTPSGRCIQKPYKKGLQDYYMDVYKRYTSGELVNKDSIKVSDSLKYKTRRLGRTVYGGGGIIPDVFVPIDTTKNYSYFNRLSAKNIIFPWVINYIDKNRKTLQKKYKTFESFHKNFVVTDKMFNDIVAKGEKAGVKKDKKSYPQMKGEIKNQVKAFIARSIWDMNETFMILNSRNKIFKEAVKVLKTNKYNKVLKK
ncbi:MAG: S41 family peptidase [Marinifilaceae bacterium]|nr:S41 family peptidase [Marinifilaceae bacterium]